MVESGPPARDSEAVSGSERASRVLEDLRGCLLVSFFRVGRPVETASVVLAGLELNRLRVAQLIGSSPPIGCVELTISDAGVAHASVNPPGASR